MRTRRLMLSLLLTVFLCGLVLPAAAQSPAESAAVRPDLPYYFEDFEAGNGGYVSVGNHPWTWGPPPAGLAPPHSGLNAWATQSPYHANALYDLRSPWIDLTGADPTHDLVLDWWQELDIEPYNDVAFVDASTDGSNWQTVYLGSQRGAWENVVADLSPFIGQTVMLRFQLLSEYGAQYNGWAIDDVSIYSGTRPLPAIAVDGPPLDVTLCPDRQETVEMEICNTGVGALNWSLSELEEGGDAPVPHPGLQASAASPASPGRPAASSLLGGRAYAFELYGSHLYEIPDLDTPGTWSLVGGVVPATTAGAFKGSDYSQEYVIAMFDQQLWTANTTTGAATLIGPCAIATGAQWTGMSWDETTDTMYAVTWFPSKLYTLNLETGAPTEVANITGASCIADIAVDRFGQMYGHDVCLDDLVRIDKLTGAVTIIGPTGFDADRHQGMDFDDTTDTLYLAAYTAGLVAELRIADVKTGWTTLVGAFPEGEVDAFAIVGPIHDTAWLSEIPAGGSLLPGECSSVAVTFDSTGMAPGDYEAELLINNDDPHTPRISLPVEMTVAEPPSILDVTYSTAGLAVTFDATAAGTAPLRFAWDFGDGGTSNLEDPTHVYAQGGCYTVMLTVGMLTPSNCCYEDTWQGQICLNHTYSPPIIKKH